MRRRPAWSIWQEGRASGSWDSSSFVFAVVRVGGCHLAQARLRQGYRWRMRVLTDSPFFSHSRWFWMPGNGLTQWSLRTAEASSGFAPGVVTLSDRLRLDPAFPNPFQAFTSLSLQSIGTVRAQVTVHDPTGREVAGLWDGSLNAGRRTVVWDGQDDEGHALPEGVYFIRAEADGETLSRSVIRVR